MPNTIFPVKITDRGASNREVIEALKTGRIGYAPGSLYWYKQRIRFAAGEFTPAAATSQELDLGTLYPARAIPSDVHRVAGMFFRVEVPISGTGITAATVEGGDFGGTTDNYFTATSCFGGSARILHSTPAAAGNPAAGAAALAPGVTIRLTGANMTAISAGQLVAYIPFRKLVP